MIAIAVAVWIWFGLLAATLILGEMKNRSVPLLVLGYLLCPPAALTIIAFAPVKAR